MLDMIKIKSSRGINDFAYRHKERSKLKLDNVLPFSMAQRTFSPLSPAVLHTLARACPDSISAVDCDVAIPCMTQSPSWWENPVILSTNCSRSEKNENNRLSAPIFFS